MSSASGNQKKVSRPVLLLFGFLLALGLLAGRFFWSNERSHPSESQVDEVVDELVATEQWILAMSQALKTQVQEEPLALLQRAKLRFQEGSPEREETSGGLKLIRAEFVKGGSGNSGDRVDELLGLKEMSELKGEIAIVSGEFLNPERDHFRAILKHRLRGQSAPQGLFHLEAGLEMDWKLREGAAAPESETGYQVLAEDWQELEWSLKKAELQTLEQAIFREVSAEIIPDTDELKLAQSSGHAQHLRDLFKTGEAELRKGFGHYFTTDATGQHPGLAVVDINQDGHDDFYVCVRWGRNLLFENQGDGTFKEAAKDYGLDLPGMTTSAIFADFDNDGDQDAYLGRSLERSVFLMNEEGQFKVRNDLLPARGTPYLTTSVSAADYNGDGLLDLYLSTYGFASRNPRKQVADDFLQDYPDHLVTEKFLQMEDEQKFINLPGPPNVLLINSGYGFEISPFSEQVAVWRETLQGTWGDYDQDGDPDLYVCNDFAPDDLFRNDGEAGFRLVTDTAGHERMMGFGMGASFGDYDNDLDLDLYVSNMYSKAGLRITNLAKTRDRRFRWFAEGNLLFGNEDERFEYLSGAGTPMETVARADWSWGGQFCDFDNDSFLDLYVPNGYFTAPAQFAHHEDL